MDTEPLCQAIDRALLRPFPHPSAADRWLADGLRLVARTAGACLAMGSGTSVVLGGMRWSAIKTGLRVGGAMAMPLSALSALWYSLLATPPEQSHGVVAEAMRLSSAQGLQFDRHRAVAERAIQYAKGLHPVEMLCNWVERSNSEDHPISFGEMVKRTWKVPIAVGGGMGLLTGAVLLSLAAAEGHLSIWPFAIGYSVAWGTLVGAIGFVVKAVEILQTPLEQAPETQQLVNLVKAKPAWQVQLHFYFNAHPNAHLRTRVNALLA